jgi:predicted  nucleic acid-binding Zn-ribbon protein
MATPQDLERILKNHLDNDTKRLDRIEAKIDRLSETVVALARVEEKVSSLEKESVRTSDIIEKLDGRLSTVEEKVLDNTSTVGGIKNLGWIVITALVGAVITYIFFTN